MRAAHAYGDSVKATLLPLFTSMSLSKGAFPFGLSAACVCNATLLLTGMVVYRSLELWSWVDCFYATSGVLTTVGILKVPQRPSARAFTALLHVASMGVSGLWIAEVSEGRRAWGRRATNLNSDTLVHALLTLPLMLLAALVLAQLEGWGLGEALYFTLTCATGLGMGDVEPVTPAARLLLPPFLFYIMGTTFQCMAAIGTALLGAVQASAQPHKAAGSSQ